MLGISPEGAVKFTKLCVVLLFAWPPWPESSKFSKRLFHTLSWIFMILPLILCLLLCNAALEQSNDYLALTKTICIGISCFHVVVKMIICKLQYPRLEILHTDMRDFLRNATSREREVLQRYVDRCGLVHLAFNISCYTAALGVIFGPLVLPQDLPTDAKYPFPVDQHPLKGIAYLHQAIVGLQCASVASVDCHAAVLIWFAGARLELLANDFKSVTCLRELNACIRKHQILLGKTKLMIHAVRYTILMTTIMITVAIITGGIHIVSQEPFIVKSQFLIMDVSFACTLFISAWAAENLMNICGSVGQGVYDADWIGDSSKLRMNILFVIQRSQHPSIISVASLLPELSLKYYTSFLSKALSFFTTLRVVIDKFEDQN